MSRPAQNVLILIAICVITYFPNLGASHLWEEDEAYFGRTAREMDERGDYIVPYFNGEISLHKPPLMYWVMQGASRLFGPTEFALRFGSPLFAIGSVLLTWQLGRRLFSERVGFWSGLVLATCLHFALVSRAAVADPELIFFCTLPIVLFVGGTRLSQARRDAAGSGAGPIRGADLSWPRWEGAYASMGIAALAKGPVGIVLPMAVIGLFLLLSQADGISSLHHTARIVRGRFAVWLLRVFWPPTFFRTVWEMRPLTALAVVGIVAVPWYWAVGVRTDGEWLRGFFLVHNVDRFMQSFENHRGGPLYYVIAICIGTFPWCMFNYQAVRQTIDGLCSRNDARPAYLLLAAWIAVWVGAFTLAGTKLPHYVLPAYPALAVIFGRFVATWTSDAQEFGRGWLRAAWSTPIIVGIGLAVVVLVLVQRYVPGEACLALLGLIPLAGGVVGLIADEFGRRRLAVAAISGTAVLFLIGLLGWGAVRVDRHQKSPVVAAWIHELALGRRVPLAAHGCFEASLLYYCDQNIERLGPQKTAAQFFAAHPGKACLLTTDRHYAEIRDQLPSDVAILRETQRFLKPEQLLLLGRQSAATTADSLKPDIKYPSAN